MNAPLLELGTVIVFSAIVILVLLWKRKRDEAWTTARS